MTAPQRLVDVGVLLFTNAIGAIVCYSLERANRTNFLESQLLMETARCDGLTGIANRRISRPVTVARSSRWCFYDASRQHAEDRARQIQAGIEALAITPGASPISSQRLTVSIGIGCVQPMSDRSHYGFIQLADEALYAAKERGRDCIVIMDKEYGDLTTGSFRKEAAAAH